MKIFQFVGGQGILQIAKKEEGRKEERLHVKFRAKSEKKKTVVDFRHTFSFSCNKIQPHNGQLRGAGCGHNIPKYCSLQ